VALALTSIPTRLPDLSSRTTSTSWPAWVRKWNICGLTPLQVICFFNSMITKFSNSGPIIAPVSRRFLLSPIRCAINPVSLITIFDVLTSLLVKLPDQAGNCWMRNVASSKAMYRFNVLCGMESERESSAKFRSAGERAAIMESNRGKLVRPSMLARSLISRCRIVVI